MFYCVAKVRYVFPNLHLGLAEFNSFADMPRIQLFTNLPMPSTSNDFLHILDGQNPELRCKEWLFIPNAMTFVNGSVLYTFAVPPYCFKQLEYINGSVYYGIGRLVFYLQSKRSIDINSWQFKFIVHHNIQNHGR